jgi:hypothetical protein
MSRQGFGRDADINSVIGNAVADAVSANAGGIFSLRPQAKYMTGARTVLKVNDKLLGFAFQVSWNINTEQTEIYTIDDPLPHEIAPKRISVSGTLGCFVIPGRSATAEVIQSDMRSFLVNKYITIEVRDSVTDEIIFQTKNAVVTNNQTSLTADQAGTMQLNWKAIGWLSEQSPEEPRNANKSSGSQEKGPTLSSAINSLKKLF